jgi:hypothetical protein
MTFPWKCPTCGQGAVIRDNDHSTDCRTFYPQTLNGEYFGICWRYIRCPNPACGSCEITVSHVPMKYMERGSDVPGKPISTWRFFPRSSAQVFPDYVPAPIRKDYEEACLISELSPKASATLSRRCLQGILRDFWKVIPNNLANEIAQIKDKCDPLTWDAIEAVRKVGNIGAHMEKDVNVIVDVDPMEAKLLIELIETVVKDWYIAAAERKKRLETVAALAKSKDAEKQAAKAVNSAEKSG